MVLICFIFTPNKHNWDKIEKFEDYSHDRIKMTKRLRPKFVNMTEKFTPMNINMMNMTKKYIQACSMVNVRHGQFSVMFQC